MQSAAIGVRPNNRLRFVSAQKCSNLSPDHGAYTARTHASNDMKGTSRAHCFCTTIPHHHRRVLGKGGDGCCWQAIGMHSPEWLTLSSAGHNCFSFFLRCNYTRSCVDAQSMVRIMRPIVFGGHDDDDYDDSSNTPFRCRNL